MKRILTYLLFTLILLTQCVFADENSIKITSVNYDTSNSLVLLNAQDTLNSQPTRKIKIVKLENPNRAYFDISSAILTCEKQNYTFSNGDLKQIIISQNTINPDVVRVVLYFTENYDISNLDVLQIKNNFILNLNSRVLRESNYFQSVYRDFRTSSHDFYEFITISTQKVIQNQTKPTNNSDLVLNQIQQAFTNPTVDIIHKDIKLNTKYYLDKVTPKDNGLLISGIGNIALEKPMILTAPTRIIYDLPNAKINPELKNKVYKLTDSDTLKIGQFEANKSRLVITTENVDKYLPIHSADNQTLLIANKEFLKHDQLTLIQTNITKSTITKIDGKTDELNLYFNKPVVHSIKRGNNDTIVYLFNVNKYDEEAIKNVVKQSNFENLKIELMPKTGIRVTVPSNFDEQLETFLGLDAKSLKIRLKTNKKNLPEKILTPITPPIIKKKKNPVERIVVIDPGHGGVDYGAIRSGINEKDINLDVSQRVAGILKSKGYNVTLTRNIDSTLSLQERVDICEKEAPDIFVSIHVNSCVKNEIYGLETHYYHDYSIDLAKIIHASLVQKVTSKDRGLFKSKFYVINHTTMPAVLVEIGFISNEQERTSLVSEQRKQATANAIAEGIMNYYKAQQK